MSDGKGKLEKLSWNAMEKVTEQWDNGRLDRGWSSNMQTIVPKELKVRLKATKLIKHTIRKQ